MVVFAEQPKARRIMPYRQFVVRLRTQKIRPKINNFALKSTREFSDIVQGNQGNKTSRKCSMACVAILPKSFDARLLAPEQCFCTGRHIQKIINQRMEVWQRTTANFKICIVPGARFGPERKKLQASIHRVLHCALITN